jgi:opacity protein-like surface antigen
MVHRLLIVTLLLAAAAGAVSAQSIIFGEKKNEIFVWTGVADVYDEWSATLVGFNYGRHVLPYLMVEGGVEHCSDDPGSNTWFTLNAMLQAPLPGRFKFYGLAGAHNLVNLQVGAGTKVFILPNVAARLEYAAVHDDDEGWGSYLRAGVILAF